MRNPYAYKSSGAYNTTPHTTDIKNIIHKSNSQISSILQYLLMLIITTHTHIQWTMKIKDLTTIKATR
jgi:hypothetical protein